MGKVTGFKEWQRTDIPKRDPELRVLDWNELLLKRSSDQSRQQAGRCMDCGIPFCQQGCPLGNLIPDWNDAVYHGQWARAYQALKATNPLPEFTGRLCPAPCEGSCVLGINDDPVTIEQMELEVIEIAFENGWVSPVVPHQELEQKVAVIGSGPAGLAAAIQLRSAGYQVDVYERDDQLGGLLRYGIPDFKLEKWVIDRRIHLMKQSGIRFFTQYAVGSSDHPWETLIEQYDAVAVCVGAQKPRDLPLEGRELNGIHFAMEYLTQQNRWIAQPSTDFKMEDSSDESPSTLQAKGKKVVILGGGDTGSDCLGTALRQGAVSVHQIELMPTPPTQRSHHNPWPQWPLVYRTSSSHEEGGDRTFAFMTQSFEGNEKGDVSALVGTRVEVEWDTNGKASFIPQGEEVRIEADLVLLALGFTQPLLETKEENKSLFSTNQQGQIIINSRFQCEHPKVFAAGDAQRGASLIVWAISDGIEMAREIDLFLSQQSVLPTRGIDAPFVS